MHSHGSSCSSRHITPRRRSRFRLRDGLCRGRRPRPAHRTPYCCLMLSCRSIPGTWSRRPHAAYGQLAAYQQGFVDAESRLQQQQQQQQQFLHARRWNGLARHIRQLPRRANMSPAGSPSPGSPTRQVACCRHLAARSCRRRCHRPRRQLSRRPPACKASSNGRLSKRCCLQRF